MQLTPAPIDTRMGDQAESTAAFLLPGQPAVLVDSGPAASVETTLAGLERAGVEQLDWIVLTHVHLDHAGAAGHLAARFPGARIAVPERACIHLADPSRLYAGTRSVWGARTDTLLGEPMAISRDRLVPIRDGWELPLDRGRLRAIATPGHTRHHLSFLHTDSSSILCGDALGIRLPGSSLARPATPPTDFSLEDSIRSIRRLAGLRPESLLLTHYGSATEREGSASVQAACELAIATLRRWSEVMDRELTIGGDDVSQRVERALKTDPPGAWDRLEKINPTWLNVAGYESELDRRAR